MLFGENCGFLAARLHACFLYQQSQLIKVIFNVVASHKPTTTLHSSNIACCINVIIVVNFVVTCKCYRNFFISPVWNFFENVLLRQLNVVHCREAKKIINATTSLTKYL